MTNQITAVMLSEAGKYLYQTVILLTDEYIS